MKLMNNSSLSPGGDGILRTGAGWPLSRTGCQLPAIRIRGSVQSNKDLLDGRTKCIVTKYICKCLINWTLKILNNGNMFNIYTF